LRHGFTNASNRQKQSVEFMDYLTILMLLMGGAFIFVAVESSDEDEPPAPESM